MTKRMIIMVFFVGVASATFIRAPYLQNVTQTSVKVMWGSDEPEGMVYWSQSPWSYTDSVSSVVFTANDGSQVHTVTIAGLSINDTIYYYVKNGSENIGYNDSSYYAVTAPADDAPFRFAFYSDSHAFNSEQGEVINAMIANNPDIVLHGGDKVTTGRNIWQFNDYFFSYGAPLMKNTPLFSTIGNHDMTYPQSDPNGSYETDIQNYRALFDLPVNNSPYDSTEDYYSFDYGSVHFVSIHAQRAQSGGYQNGYYNPTYNDSMLAWLERDLQQTDKPWKVVFFHKPIFMNWLEPQGWDTILENNDVQLVLNGHLHYYYAHNRNSVTYIIAAGGGAGIGDINWWEWPEYYIGAFRDHHYVQVDVSDSMLNIKVFDDNNVLRHWIDVDPLGNAVYPPTEAVDDFEEYTDDIGLQGAWQWVGIVEDVPMDAIQIYLDTDSLTESKVMRVESSFSIESRDGYGYAGLPAFWDWSGYIAIRLWAKSSLTGYSDQYFQIRLHEGSGGEKWKSPQVNLNSIAPEGEYINLYFNDFTKYGDGGGNSLINNTIDLNAIVNIFVIPGFNGLATDNGTSTILLDNFTVVYDSLNTDTESTLSGEFMLSQNYPNPFNPVTTIRYNLPKTSNVQLTIYNSIGREVVKLVNKRMDAGSQSVLWNGKDRFGQDVATGVYFYHLKTDDFISTKKLLLIK